MNVTIVGLGLIGGSLAKTIRKTTDCAIFGIDRCAKTLDLALESHAISHAYDANEPGEIEKVLGRSDMVFLCLYPSDCIDFAEQYASHFKQGCIVTDVCGVKTGICRALMPVAARHGFHFIGAHPMAGLEQGGFEHATDTLFRGASFIVTPEGADKTAAETLCGFALSLGFGWIIRTTPQKHDRTIAFTSQVPHALAAAYVLSPYCAEHIGFSAGSYRDVSRVAMINETLWSELFVENSAALTAEIDTLIDNLISIRHAVFHQDKQAVAAILQQGRHSKEVNG